MSQISMSVDLNMGRRLLWFILVGCGRVAFSEAICEAKTCRECISSRNMCVWCSAETFDLDNRCRPALEMNNQWCPSEHIQNPKGELTIEGLKAFSSSPGHLVQLKPQQFHLNLRVGERQSFNFSYKSVEDYPVDIYFLLDASKSMTMQKNYLQAQSENIHNTMKNLTRDVYFGLGTFCDKNLVPFNDKPSNGTAYSFKHELNLSQDLERFRETLARTTFGENFDNPESGLDGIAQVIACKKLIKWREQSRKILVFMTDAKYHVAGDGKHAGLIQPYNGECHLDEKGFYYMEKKMDYPSIGHISKMAADEQIVILFVSSSGLRDNTVYSDLRWAVSGAFHARSEKIITRTLKEIYEQITETIDLRVSMPSQGSEHVTITFEPNCQSKQGGSHACLVAKGEEKHFSGTIGLNNYFGMEKFNIAINPKGLKENVILNVDVITNCLCDKKSTENSTKCNNAGKWSCGVCECLKNKHGPTCSCSNNVTECKRENATKYCSGHGHCICGSCSCDQGYGGKFCHYLVDNCPRGVGLELCSGHGACRDGVCECHGGHEGEACECPTCKEPCMKNHKECSNRGQCHCGQCKCDVPAAWDARARDELCQLIPSPLESHHKQCRYLIPCEECLHRRGDCRATCGDRMTVIDHDIPEDIKANWSFCSNVRVDFGCYANYSYIYNDNDGITMFILHERSCTESQIMIGVISLATLVAAGLATLVAWKLLTDARDRREFAQFKKAMETEAQAQVNAMYKNPCTTYRNPAFECHLEE